MEKLKILVVDDEQPVRELLLKVVPTYCTGVEIIGQAHSLQSALKAYRELQPDVILLDINLPDGNGFDLLAQIEGKKPKIIFITAYNEFAIKAFKISAVDYILKPLNIDELVVAIEKCKEQTERENLSEKLKVLVENMSGNKPDEKKIVLKTQESIYIVKVGDIIRCESDHNYTEFYLREGKKLLVSKTLKDFETMLDSYGFFRTHQSHLINLNYIARFDKADGGELVLTDGKRVPVSVRKRDELFELFNQM
jgi:two-component system, LytTR family, response regulator